MSSKIIVEDLNILIVFLNYIIFFYIIFLTYTYKILLPLNGP